MSINSNDENAENFLSEVSDDELNVDQFKTAG